MLGSYLKIKGRAGEKIGFSEIEVFSKSYSYKYPKSKFNEKLQNS